MSFLAAVFVIATVLSGTLGESIPNNENFQVSFSDFYSSESLQGQDCWVPVMPKISNRSSVIYDNIKASLTEAQSRAKILLRFQGAIKIDTQVNDDFGDVDSDVRWSKFYHFSAFLSQEFPLVHKYLSLEKINRHGLLYTWEPPSQADYQAYLKKPFLLMAHQDTVSVANESLADWKFDPFEGHVDRNGIMYGRGVHDDKNSLISILEGVELLLQNDFEPNRTVLLAFGFDEEVSGRRGALEISKFLEQKYGKNGVEFILDEGPGVMDPVVPAKEVAYATVATAEKGYLDVLIELKAPGGHSSLAGKHSLIGLMAEIIVSLENEDPFLPRVSKKNPIFDLLSCQSFDNLDIPTLLHRIQNGDTKAEYELGRALQTTSISGLTRTSQAIDLIKGGQKINALPERVSVGINYRVATDSSLQEIKLRIVSILDPIAVKYNMSSCFFNDEEDLTSPIRLRVSQIGKALEPAKMSPRDSKAYSIIFGTVRSSLTSHYRKAMNIKSLQVVSTLMAGNTDTRHYWNLTNNLFRFRPTRIDSMNNGGHTVNERIHVSDHFASIQFYSSLILSASEM